MISMADVLQHLGFKPLIDFVTQNDGSGEYIKIWLTDAQQPTQAEIEAAALPALAELEQIRLDGLADEQSRQRAKAAYTQLQTIVDGIDGATLAQAKTAIKQIAQISQDLIRATVGR